MGLVSTYKWLIIKYVVDLEFNCLRHQGWYDTSKYIGIYVVVIEGSWVQLLKGEMRVEVKYPFGKVNSQSANSVL